MKVRSSRHVYRDVKEGGYNSKVSLGDGGRG